MYAVAEVVGEVGEHEAWIGCLEMNLRRQTVHDLDGVDPDVHVGGEGQHRRVALEQVDGEGQVVGGPGHAITPGHTLSKVDRHLCEFVVVLMPGGEPGDNVVGVPVGVVEVEGLEEHIDTRTRGGTRHEGVEGIVVLIRGTEAQDQCPIAWHRAQSVGIVDGVCAAGENE